MLSIISCSNSENLIRKNGLINSIELSLDTLQIVKEIERKYSEINSNIQDYEKVDLEIFGKSAEGGEMIAFYSGKELRKIISTFYGETGKVTVEYFFNKNSELFFVLKNIIFYDKPIYEKDFAIQSKEESSYYIFENEIIKWIKNTNKTVSLNSKEFQKELKNINDEVNELKALLSK